MTARDIAARWVALVLGTLAALFAVILTAYAITGAATWTD